MSCYAIGIGGTGARCVESLIHLSAAGLGPDKLFVLLVDPDDANGSVDQTKQVVSRYQYCRENLKPTRASGLFRTELTHSYHNNHPVIVWSPTVEESNLDDYFKFSLMDEGLQNLARLLYTSEELRMNLELGFRGHSSVGAPVMARMQDALNVDPWHDLIESMRADIGKSQNPRVFLFASIFGATGASGFPTIGKILRAHTRGWPNGQRVRIGGSLLLPYFAFGQTDEQYDGGEIMPCSDNFLINTKAALNHYRFFWRDANHNPFNANYYLGESRPDAEGRRFAPGGQEQSNPAHYIEALSGMAALHFYRDNEGDAPIADLRHRYFAGRSNQNWISWRDLPAPDDFQSRFVKFATLAAAYLGFYYPQISAADFEHSSTLLPWHPRNFRPGDLTQGSSPTEQLALADYFAIVMKWLYETHHFAGGREIRLLSRAVLDRAQASGFKQWPDEDFGRLRCTNQGDPEPRHKRAYEKLSTLMNRSRPESDVTPATGRLVSMLYNAVSSFCDTQYSL